MDDASLLENGQPPQERARKARKPIPERLLARLWQKRAARQEGFRTGGGRRVRVIYPGRSGQSAGPDFRNALLEVEGVGLVQGDVEIHVRQQDWDAHGHGAGPRYNGVVLHAALEVDASTTSLQSGGLAPVVSLTPLLAEEETDAPPDGRLWGLLERQGYPRPETAAAAGILLDRAGDQRFLGKSSRFQRFLAEQAPAQTLYEAIMEALGYAQNQQPFLNLAARAPCQALAQAVRTVPPEQQAEAIESWLLRLSGLASAGEARFAPLPRAGFGPPLAAGEWHCFRLRPANHPRRRIAGAARLLARFMGPGLVAGLQRAADEGSPRALAAGLTVAADQGDGAAYIGADRARDLAVNVVLPFFHGLASLHQEEERGQAYLGLYQRFGRLQENEVTREMADQLLGQGWREAVTTARRQQGLVHLHRALAGAR